MSLFPVEWKAERRIITAAASPAVREDRLIGDSLVPLASALGHHKGSARDLKSLADRRWIAPERRATSTSCAGERLERIADWLSQDG